MIRRHNLDPSLIQWLMTLTGAGPGLGDVHYLVKPNSAYYSWLKDDLRVDGAHIHHDFKAGEDALTADRNDCLLVYPGRYTEITSTAWDKAHTHLIGLGGPNAMGHYRTSSENDRGNTLIHTVTTEVAEVINVTGKNCQFHNIHVHNEGSHASNVAALKLNGYGFQTKNCTYRGATGTDALTAVEAGSVYLHTDADYCLFENCNLGHNTYSAGVKSGVASGHLVFSVGTAVAGPQNGKFKGCHFQLRSQTVTAGLVRLAGTPPAGGNMADRDWLFEDCLFTNIWVSWQDQCNAVFVGVPSSTCNIILRRCTAVGFDEWQDLDLSNMIVADMPVVDSGGGLVRVPSTGPFTSVIRDYTNT